MAQAIQTIQGDWKRKSLISPILKCVGFGPRPRPRPKDKCVEQNSLRAVFWWLYYDWRIFRSDEVFSGAWRLGMVGTFCWAFIWALKIVLLFRTALQLRRRKWRRGRREWRGQRGWRGRRRDLPVHRYEMSPTLQSLDGCLLPQRLRNSTRIGFQTSSKSVDLVQILFDICNNWLPNTTLLSFQPSLDIIVCQPRIRQRDQPNLFSLAGFCFSIKNFEIKNHFALLSIIVSFFQNNFVASKISQQLITNLTTRKSCLDPLNYFRFFVLISSLEIIRSKSKR